MPPKEDFKQTFPKGTSKVMPLESAAARPLVTVHNLQGLPMKKSVPLPDIMLTPIRTDLVNYVHTAMNKNRRQPYAVMNREGPRGLRAGHQVAAKSWGTGRAVSRVPRVKGGGTHRAGQGAYANMCRGGRMFSPTKRWRRWHRKMNHNQKRYAVASAVAASAVPALVMARGHRCDQMSEIPFVVEDDFCRLTKTKAVTTALSQWRLKKEMLRCKKRYMRAGKGKMRNRRWRHRLGPLIVYHHYQNAHTILYAHRNIRGLDICRVDQLNLLKLAPGGHVGRLVIWTESAFRALNKVWGTQTKGAIAKNWRGRQYQLPRAVMRQSDLERLIMSDEIQSVLRVKKLPNQVTAGEEFQKKRNPLKHPELMAELNPLFAERYNEMKESGKFSARRLKRMTYEQVMEPLQKKQRVNDLVQISKEEQEQMAGYWHNVFGQDKIFKSQELLAAEKEAVADAIAQQEREKAGLDIMDAAKAAQDKADADAGAKDDDDEDSS